MQKRVAVTLRLFFLVVIILVANGCGAKNETENQGQHSSQTQQLAVSDSVGTSLPTMLELGSHGCIPCEKMVPVMEELRTKHGKLVKIEFHDVHDEQEFAQKYNIRLIPTQIFLTADGEEFYRHEGFYPAEEIEEVFRRMGVAL